MKDWHGNIWEWIIDAPSFQLKMPWHIKLLWKIRIGIVHIRVNIWKIWRRFGRRLWRNKSYRKFIWNTSLRYRRENHGRK